MIAHVALAIPVAKVFSYSVPPRLEPFVEPFVRARVPFRQRVVSGVIVGTEEGESAGLKEILEITDFLPLLDEGLAALAEWAAVYYATPLGVVLKYALPTALQIETFLLLNPTGDGVPDLPEKTTLRKACKMLGREEVFRSLRQGLITLRDKVTGRPFEALRKQPVQVGEAGKTLYVGSIEDRLAHYSESVAPRLTRGENVLLLVPDFHTVGRYFLGVLRERFGDAVLWYGTAVSNREGMATYFKARHRTGHLILGNKSCTFLPVSGLSLVVVDRPEEEEYRNEESFRFDAGVLAIKRAEIEQIPAVVGSAAPPLGVFRQAMEGGFELIFKEWPPEVGHKVVTIGKGLSSSAMLPETFAALISEASERNERVAIYTPRKGYGAFMRCGDCGGLVTCTVCGGMASYEKARNLLFCPVCGKSTPYQGECASCGSRFIQFSQAGAEYLEEALKQRFGRLPVVRVGGESGDAVNKLRAEAEKRPMVIVGSHMLSKLYGVRVDKLVLVGWEELLQMGGYRAEERMHQVIMNLLDAMRPSEIVGVMERRKWVDLGGFLRPREFCEKELEKRKAAAFPPYERLFLIEVEREDEKKGSALVTKIKERLGASGLASSVTGPLVQKRRKYRWRMLLRGQTEQLHGPLMVLYEFPGVRIEPDPVSV
jgi:primosomal protein N' (replication factor Y)